MEEGYNVLKKGKGILLTLFSTHPKKHTKIYSNELDELMEKLNLSKYSLKASMWGNFDIAFLVSTDSKEKLLEFYDLQPLPFTKDWRYYFGTCFYPSEIDIKKIMEELPLFGISFIKFKKEMWASLNTNLDDFLDWLVKKIDFRANEKNFKLVVIASYGWEDIILLFFSNSYRRIKRAILKLRASRASELEEAGLLKQEGEEQIGQHLIATTCSMLGVNFDFGLLQKESKDQKAFLQKIKNEKINWEIRFQIRPGHSDKPRHKLRGKYIIGRNDLAIKASGTLREFFDRFFFSKDNILSFISKDNTSISSTETSFFLDFGDEDVEGGEIGSDWLTRQKGWEPPDFEPLQDMLFDKIGIPLHTSKAIKNLLVATDHLKRELELINDSFISLFNMLENLLGAFALVEKIKSDSNFANKLKMKTLRELEVWFWNFDLCFKDRFRGIYPAGETSTMPLITYQGSFHKFLLAVDSIACLAFERARLSCKEEFKEFSHKPPPHIIVTHIGNPPSPCIYKSTLLLSGFIYAPVDLMFYPERLFYIFHETGHSFFSMCEFWDFLNVEKVPNDKVQDLFDEVLADYFAGAIGCGGNWRVFETLARPYFYYLAPGEIPELELRLALSKALYNYIEDGKMDQFTKENPEIEKVLSNPELHEEAKALPDYLIKNLESETTHLKRLLNSIRRKPLSFDPEYENLLVMLREFFERVAENFPFSDQKRRYFFHSFWLEAYKKAVSAFKSVYEQKKF